MLFAEETQGFLTTRPPGKCLCFKYKYVLLWKKKKKKEEASKTDRANDTKEI